ncbi:MmyB family transcriptional regulator [Nonomuraea guangzhouensis]|uniref:MmyB-like transcription regulator ligand binding domain-containing protein n=1 Tax=Nonomuraea guangzhouensis TaxID=1291555 RepID=A0ABW4G674_9ACTN
MGSSVQHDAVGSLRTEAARTPANTGLADLADLADLAGLADLIDELATHSEEFALRWDAHDVEYYRSGRQHFHHPDVGDLDLDYDALEVPADPGLTIVAYSIAPAAAHAGAFARLHDHVPPRAPGQRAV